MVTADFPSFASFFSAVNRGREPFPWQHRLAARVAEGSWPDSIGVPTGMGKTACIDIAVWALARQAATRSPMARTAGTRTWYVVNRRLLIDVAFERAWWLASVLADPARLAERWPGATDADRDVVRVVADALRAAGAGIGRDPLHVARLRGGAELGQRPPDPSQPALILATVPMFASRLLFRGYGSSTSMRPVDAALAGADSLVLLDEAHLARPLTRLIEVGAICDPGDPGTLLPGARARCRLVALTATGDEGRERFDLSDEDHQHPVIQRRLTATKPVDLVSTTTKNLAGVLAARARDLVSRRPGSACVVFCNTVSTARKVLSALRAADGRSSTDETALLLTGRMREREAERARRRLLDPAVGAPAGRDPRALLPRSLMAVATQTLEVGADLDFDFLVSETAGARALTQRLGRLNRFGERLHAQAALCHPTDATPQPPYREEPASVWMRLEDARERLQDAGGVLDLAPASIGGLVGPPQDAPERVGELLPEHLWELAKTSFPEPDEPPVELFFEGLEADADLSVCWRAYLPPDGVKLVPPVREEEAIEIPARELREALESRADKGVHRLAADRSTLEIVALDQLRPGDQVVLPAETGLYDEDGWNPEARETVLDVAPLRRGTLWLTAAALRNLLRDEPPPEVGDLLRQFAPEEEELDRADERAVVQSLLDLLAAVEPHPWIEPTEWQEYLGRFRDARLVQDAADLPPYLEATRPPSGKAEIRAEVFEELSFEAKSAGLADHQGSVAELAGRIARKLGLPDEVVASLAWAGHHHDLGKNDPRFQRWLDPDGECPEPVAKSNVRLEEIEPRRVASGWPRGGRHELLSVRLLERRLADYGGDGSDPELALHLVASHHGHGRPWIGVVADGAPATVAAAVDGAPIRASGDLSQPEWAQPRRFRTLCQRHGVWGLALLEAVLRQADHLASGAVEVA